MEFFLSFSSFYFLLFSSSFIVGGGECSFKLSFSSRTQNDIGCFEQTVTNSIDFVCRKIRFFLVFILLFCTSESGSSWTKIMMMVMEERDERKCVHAYKLNTELYWEKKGKRINVCYKCLQPSWIWWPRNENRNILQL